MSNTTTSTKAYRELAEIIRGEGFFEKAPHLILSELAIHLLLHFGGLVLFITVDNVWWRIAAMLISAYGGLGIATSTHTSSHHATCQRRWINRSLTWFGYTFLFGTSAEYWWNKHCVVHHPAPNVVGVDDDVDLMPFFAINEREYSASRGLRRLVYDLQWLVIVPAIGLNTFFTQFQGWRYLLPFLFDPKRRRNGHWLDLGVLFLHYTAFLAIPMLFFAPGDVLLVYALRLVLMGYAMFIAFAPAHFPEEALFTDKAALDQDYLLLQTATTVNFETGFLGRLVCGGVDYQIEHHLFPQVPHVFYPRLSPIVREFCESRGYPYRTLGWAKATWKSLEIFYRPKEVLPLDSSDVRG